MTGTALFEAVEAHAGRTPAAPALSWRGSVWRYGDLGRAQGCVRRALAERGLGSGARVALLLRNSPQFAAASYGAMAAGCAAVPLNVQERADVLARQIEHVDAGLVVADGEHPEWPALAAALAAQRRACVALALDDGPGAPAAFCRAFGGCPLGVTAPVSPAALATILYTSGTTARPKAVMLSHANLAANARAIVDCLGIAAEDRVLCVLPLHFSYGASVLSSHLLAGAHVLLEDNLAFPHTVLGRLQDEGITAFPGVPSTFALLLARCRLKDYDLRALRYVTQAGGRMPQAHVERLRQELPGARLFVMYGQSEATARIACLPPERLDDKPGAVGVPVADTQVEIRRDGRVLGTGETGEICVRGPGVMRGYWRDPAASAHVLRDGWLYTGDLGHLDTDGCLYIDGRASEMIKVGAFRVSPYEIEEALVACAGVEEAAVTGIEDPILGQVVKAVVVGRAGARVDVRELQRQCRARLASYKVPKIIEVAAALPRTSSGKVRRHALA